MCWLVVLFYGVSTLFGSFNAELNFKKIQFSISIVFVCKQLNVKTVLFQTVQFTIHTEFSSVWPMDRTLSASTPSQSGPGNERGFGIPQSSSITGNSPSDCLVSYPEHFLGVSYPSAEKQSVYSTAPADWAMCIYIYIYIHTHTHLPKLSARIVYDTRSILWRVYLVLILSFLPLNRLQYQS